MRFKAKAWKTGTGLVLTLPSALDVKEGDRFLVTLEGVNCETEKTRATD